MIMRIKMKSAFIASILPFCVLLNHQYGDGQQVSETVEKWYRNYVSQSLINETNFYKNCIESNCNLYRQSSSENSNGKCNECNELLRQVSLFHYIKIA